MNGVDDGTVHINLGHNFPYYGGVFTDAWMSSNGFIMFYDPTTGFGNSNTSNNGCCSGFNPSGQGSFSYMLAPLWTDLRHNTSIPDSGYFYETGTDGTAFLWQNITEYGTNNLNTFGVQLWPDGSFDFHYADVNITNHTTWIGFTGDTSYVNSNNIYEEVNEIFYKSGSMNMDDVASFASVVNETENGTFAAWYGQDGGYESAGPDCSNPLNDPSCEGYAEAYFNQQCEQNPLYDTQCPGYEQAYYEQQCSADPLYDSGCPGYAEAYYDQQCELDPLYDSGCPGYAEAYYNQQCSLDALYDSGCPGYAEAYYNQQCSLDALYDKGCAGYDDAYFEYQCTLNPQYDKMCKGYIDDTLYEDPIKEMEETFSGVDDGSDDGSNVDAFGNEKEDFFYEEEKDFIEESYIEEMYAEEKFDAKPEETFIDKDEKMYTDELVANDGSVDEMKVLEESVFFEEPDPIEEEIVILEEKELAEAMKEEEVLEEEVELDTVELVPVTEKVVSVAKVDVTSLVLQQTAELISNLKEESVKSAENYSQNSEYGQNSQEITQKTENLNESDSTSSNFANIEEVSAEENGNYMTSEQFLFGSDNASFAMMTGNVSNTTESVSNDTESVSNATENEQSVALGDSAPIGFAIIPVQTANGVVETVVPVEEQSLAERLAEQVRQRNLENSNEAAVGQTAVLQQIASGTDMTSYYDQIITYSQSVYKQDQVYGDKSIEDNNKTHYQMFSDSHGTMYQLIRSQY